MTLFMQKQQQQLLLITSLSAEKPRYVSEKHSSNCFGLIGVCTNACYVLLHTHM